LNAPLPACSGLQGVAGDVRCGELALDLVPLEDDVLSLELEHAFKVGGRSGMGSRAAGAAQHGGRLSMGLLLALMAAPWKADP